MIARRYALTAAAGKEEALRVALLGLAARIAALPGGARVDVMRDRKRPASYVFIETWTTDAAAQEAGKRLGREAFAEVMAALAAPPEVVDYEML